MSIQIVKPWGKETILTTNNLPYTGKIIYIKQGNRLSLQYHDTKTETLTLLSGEATLLLGQDKDTLSSIDMMPQEGYTIHPMQIHRIIAKTDALIVEVSTPEAGTTFRLEDDFSRKNETPDVRGLNNRGWDDQNGR